ncbi:hypothetical protein ACP4OV_027416 [Aristida adscensionis]
MAACPPVGRPSPSVLPINPSRSRRPPKCRARSSLPKLALSHSRSTAIQQFSSTARQQLDRSGFRARPYALCRRSEVSVRAAGMDVYISEEYVVRRRAERMTAAPAAAVQRGGCEAEKARGGSTGGQTRWWAATCWAETGKRAGEDGNASAAACRVGVGEDDAVLSCFSA